MWSIAHSQGYRLPTKDYFEFVELITVNPKKVKSLDDYLKILHDVTEKIQSSPSAIERSVYEIIGKEYRGSLVGRIELRFNPMKRNLHGERPRPHHPRRHPRHGSRHARVRRAGGAHLLPRP